MNLLADIHIMDKEDIIKEVHDLLKEISDKAEQQLTSCKKQHHQTDTSTTMSGVEYIMHGKIFTPHKIDIARTFIEANRFLCSLVEVFWKLYRLSSESIENPVVQFSMRPLLELCYGQIMYFSLQEPTKRKDIATQYWLCNIGLLIRNKQNQENAERLKTYDSLITELSEERSKNQFIQIRDTGFPIAALSRKLYKLFPSLSDGQLKEKLKPFLINIYGEKYSEEYVEIFYREFSQYVHANALPIINMWYERKTKGHILRCALLQFLIGCQILRFTNEKMLAGKDDKDITAITERIKKTTEILLQLR